MTRMARAAAILGILFLVGFAFVYIVIFNLTRAATTEVPKLGTALDIITPILTGLVAAVVAIHLGQPEPIDPTKPKPRTESTPPWWRRFLDRLIATARRLGATLWPSTNEGRQAVMGWIYFIVYFGFAAIAFALWISKGDLTPAVVSQLVLVSLGLGAGVIRSWMTQPNVP